MELFAGYSRTDYDKPPLQDIDDRDSTGMSSSISWIWLFKPDSFLNLKYHLIDQDAQGANWDFEGHRLSANVTIPLAEKVKLQLSGQAYYQQFKNTNPNFNTAREDSTYTLSGGFSWECYKNTTFVSQISKIRDDSNIGIYDYDRELYTVGIEYRF